jgi:hypothetical protein
MSFIAEIRKNYKIFGLSVFDIVSSMIGLAVIFVIAQQVWFKNLNIWHFILAGIILAIPVGIVFHVIFGVNTTLNYRLGLSNKPI